MSALVRGMKSAFWRCLARPLAAGASLIRRRPGPTTADEWRASEVSFAHHAEDLLVLRLLRDRAGDGPRGVYVDVGAFDPVYFSNTLLLYRHGWRGVNIDANRERVERLRRLRPGDVAVHAVVSDVVRKVCYLSYPTEGLNRIVDAAEGSQTNARGETPTRVEVMTTCTLEDVLDRSLPSGAAIDFLNVDCEGEDLNVLAGLDWPRRRPRVVAAEANSQPERERLTDFMRARDYRLAAQALVTLLFIPREATGAGGKGPG